MSDCGCHPEASTSAERRILRIALALNAMMFVIGFVAGLIAQSMGLIADSLDMLADASAYAIGLIAVARSIQFKASAGRASGAILLLLGLGVVGGVAWRFWVGSDPQGLLIIGIAFIALTVNTIVLRLLERFRHAEIHLRATWLFTRVDVIANLAVIISGVLVLALKSAAPDLIIGAALGLYIIREAVGILREAHEQKTKCA